MSLGRPRGGIIGGAGADSMNKGSMLGHDLTATLPISKYSSYLRYHDLDPSKAMKLLLTKNGLGTSTTNVATKHHINLKPEN